MLSKAEIGRLQSLRRRKIRTETGLFVAEGVRVVEDLIASTIVLDRAFISPSLEDTERGARLARELRTRVQTMDVTDRELGTIAGTDQPQGVVVVASIPRATLAAVAALLPATAHAAVVVLDAVQDPGNFGTVVRCADAFNALFVVVLPGTVDPWNPKAVRAAAGSSLRLPIVEATLDELLAFARTHDMQLWGADMEGDDVAAITPPARTALVLGNEGAGLSADVRAACDRFVAIPIRGGAESLNVGVAAGILLYSLGREPSA
ncbi:RNA methyltransferase [soil metagenome]